MAGRNDSGLNTYFMLTNIAFFGTNVQMEISIWTFLAIPVCKVVCAPLFHSPKHFQTAKFLDCLLPEFFSCPPLAREGYHRTSGESALDVENLPCANGCSEVPILTLPLGSVPLTRKVMHIRPPLQTGIVKKIVQKKLAANGQLFCMFFMAAADATGCKYVLSVR